MTTTLTAAATKQISTDVTGTSDVSQLAGILKWHEWQRRALQGAMQWRPTHSVVPMSAWVRVKLTPWKWDVSW